MDKTIIFDGKTYSLTQDQITKIEKICGITKTPVLCDKKISDFSGKNFFVKDYQRGYRWEPSEVEALLDDIYKINENEEGYCMQPLVVKKMPQNIETFYFKKLGGEANNSKALVPEGAYELLDGQQRLTTIWLISDFLENSANYCIFYELIREVDNYYIQKAKETIKAWFATKVEFNNNLKSNGNKKNKEISLVWKMNAKSDFCKKINKLFFIWYEIKDDNIPAEKVFKSINEGKIELTNAELFKALLLNPDNINFNSDTSNFIKLQQIAFEWDKLEQSLRNDDFWYFISQDDIEKSSRKTRIDYIVEIYARELNKREWKLDPDKDRFSFLVIQKHIDSCSKSVFDEILDVWENIVKVFDKLYSWYEDFELYHTVGFLVAAEERNRGSSSVVSRVIVDLYHECKDVNIEETKKIARNKINDILIKTENGKEITTADIKYAYVNENNYDITVSSAYLKNILLFTNIYSLAFLNKDHKDENDEKKHNLKGFIKFPFKLYHTSNWDIEHIFPRTLDKNLDSHCRTAKEFTKNIEALKKDIEVIEKEGLKDDDESVRKISQIDKYLSQTLDDSNYKTVSGYKECCDIWNNYADELNQYPDNDIGNLVLLNSSINRSYGNAFFSEKRKSIIKFDKEGFFIPVCTRNVFAKYYSDSPDNLNRWEDSDKNSYTEFIDDMLKEIKRWKK